MTPDYKKILTAYMRGVVRAEGVTFVGWANSLTDVERDALSKIENDIIYDELVRKIEDAS